MLTVHHLRDLPVRADRLALRGAGGSTMSSSFISGGRTIVWPPMTSQDALHPMGIAPVITDGDLVLGEGGAICNCICARRPRLEPARSETDFADHLFWFHWSNGTFPSDVDDAARPGRRRRGQSRRGFRGRPQPARLGDGRSEARAPFFGGANLTADIMMVYCLTTSRAFRGSSIEQYPNLKAYLGRIGARPPTSARWPSRARHDAHARLTGARRQTRQDAAEGRDWRRHADP